jgi:hypothetical protein
VNNRFLAVNCNLCSFRDLALVGALAGWLGAGYNLFENPAAKIPADWH